MEDYLSGFFQAGKDNSVSESKKKGKELEKGRDREKKERYKKD